MDNPTDKKTKKRKEVGLNSAKAFHEYVAHNVRFYDFEPKAIHCMSYEDETSRLALSRADGSIEIWNCTDQPFMQNVLPDDESSVEGVAWCQGRLFSAGLHGFILEHNVVTGEVISRTAVTGGPTWCLALSPDKRKLAAGTEEGYVCLFDVLESGIMYDKMLDKQEGRILHLTWHCSGDFIVTGSINFVRLWSLKTGRVTRCSIPHQGGEEIIVWCVGILDDMIIVSGDSRGKVCFWNGNLGVITQVITTHKADVLSLVITSNQKTVYVAGVDPVIVQVTRVRTEGDGKGAGSETWVKTHTRHLHTHDVRALTLTAENRLYSGGVDTILALSYYPPKTVLKFHANPPHGSVCVAGAASCVLLRYCDRLELWRLGCTIPRPSGTRKRKKKSKSTAVLLPILEDRAKLLEIRSKQGRLIDWCAVSQNALWIVYIVSYSLRICQFCPPGSGNQAGVRRVRGLSKDILPSYQAVWLQEAKLASASTTGVIQIISISEIEANVEGEVHLAEGPSVVQMTPSSDGHFLGVVDNKNQVTVINIELGEKYPLPRYDSPVTAVGMHPSTRVVVVAHADMMIKEFSLDTQQYTPFTRQALCDPHPDLHRRSSVIRNISFDPQDSAIILFHDDDSIIILNKSKAGFIADQQNPAEVDGEIQSSDANNSTSNARSTSKVANQPNPIKVQGKMPNPTKAKGNIQSSHTNNIAPKAKSTSIFSFVNRTNRIVYFSHVKDDSVVSVELNHLQLQEKLPPMLKLKKYGAG